MGTMGRWLRVTIPYVLLSNLYASVYSFPSTIHPLREASWITCPPSLLKAVPNEDLGEGGGERLPQPDWQGSRTSQYLATCIPGLSTVLAQELVELKCRNVLPTSKSGVTFQADLRGALGVLMWTRTAHKVLELLCQGDSISDRDSLMKFVRDSVSVKDLLGDGRGGLLSLSVQVVMTGGNSALARQQAPSDLTHSKFTAMTIKNGLCDAVRELRGDRPNVDVENPDVPLVAFVRGTSVSLYRQLHVGSLHRRGYRSGSAVHKAAMKESLAAGLLMQAGWLEHVIKHKQKATESNANARLVLADPMAGSGTFLIEAALMASDVAPGLMRLIRDNINNEAAPMPGQRLPPVVRWKQSLDDGPSASRVWKELLVDASERAKRGLTWLRSSRSIVFCANDSHPGALDLFEYSLKCTDEYLPGLSSSFEIHQENCGDWVPAQLSPSARSENAESDEERLQCVVVCNPPWGERLSEDMHDSWESLRTFLRETCPPSTEAWILSGNAAATKHLGLKRSASFPLQTGQQDLRWLQYFVRGKSSSSWGSQDSLPVGVESEEQHVELNRQPERIVGGRSPASRSSRSMGSRGRQVMQRQNARSNEPRNVQSVTAKKPPKTENEWLI
jgi:23S rRNA G2445 N2-methylase RlmL